ncbi:LOW QUALITY PROTEIN: Hypothetical protein PHPALM_11843 [Phytophthora palmivora]|uniref:Uncharacterized protein n=1 Tax=Phytophthora palmivora TaxID=4796 RepID=A0A2P4Y188_9STRA|nr:LOW QUALITY PROTEIN: Hypothetical protein PHPALM_11843 [Phytophthora palmivora]
MRKHRLRETLLQGVPVARQYYHARKRSDESPLEYLYRLNGLGPASRSRMDLRKFDVNTWSISSKLWMIAILQITWPY